MIDASLGEPLFPFEAGFEHAFARTRGIAHQYDNYGDYQQRLLGSFSHFFRDIGICTPNYGGVSASSFVATNGTTGGFSMLTRMLGEEAQRYNKLVGEDITPVILMPVPTYGLFFQQPRFNCIEVVTIPRDRKHGWRLDPETLDRAITDIHASGKKRVVAFYDCNPNNPTGHIRDEEETRALGAVFTKHARLGWEKRRAVRQGINDPYDERELASIPSSIRIIDDMVYLGLEYGEKKPFPFMAIRDLYADCVTLFGGSKVGLAALRAGGMICGRTQDADWFRDQMKLDQYFPSIPALHGLEALFSDNDALREARTLHLTRLNAAHAFSGKLLKALVNGIDTLSGLEAVTPNERQEMIDLVAKVNGMSRRSAEARLKQGIPEISVISAPESGFFHMLDFSALHGRQCSSRVRNAPFNIPEPIDHEGRIQSLTRAMDLELCPVSNAGESYLFRASFAFPPEVIVSMANRLEMAVGLTAQEGQPVPDNVPRLGEYGLPSRQFFR